jgi:hypothetical protein
MNAITTTRYAAALASQFRALPDEAFTRLQYFSPATGCFNRCVFCSQQAGRDIWQLTASGLADVAGAFARVAAERGLRIAAGRTHRPGVLFPYLDNDIASYPHLDILCALAHNVLQVKLRISTVGYSRHNTALAAMHQRITAHHSHVFDGIRLSLTPYTSGWADNPAGGTSRAEFTSDLANALATYQPVLDWLGHGPTTAAVELRFAPLAGIADLTDTTMNGRHVIGCGPHLLIGLSENAEPLPLTVIERLDQAGQPVFSTGGRRYLHITADGLTPGTDAVSDALAGRLSMPHEASVVTVFRFANADGDYYAADPDFHPDGRFAALHLYPATASRRRSGYTDATRHFLNTLLGHKASRGLQRRDLFPAARWDDVTAVLTGLASSAAHLDRGIDHMAAQHLQVSVIPLVTIYADALRGAGYPPEVFFSRDFTIDTGQIVNQGRAKGLFRGLVSLDGEPMTPREERGFGQASLSSIRGPIWRLAPAPFTPAGHLPVASAGGKNTPTTVPSLIVEELDPCHLRPVLRGSCTMLRRYIITGADLEHLALGDGRANYGYPGLQRAA